MEGGERWAVLGGGVGVNGVSSTVELYHCRVVSFPLASFSSHVNKLVQALEKTPPA